MTAVGVAYIQGQHCQKSKFIPKIVEHAQSLWLWGGTHITPILTIEVEAQNLRFSGLGDMFVIWKDQERDGGNSESA